MPERLRSVFAPGAIGALNLPHRVVMGAMHLGLETRDDDGASLAAFYRERALGGAGLMVTGGAAVSPAGVGGHRYGVLNDGAFRGRLARTVREVHAVGGLIGLQLFHAGRYAPTGAYGPVAPSAVFSRFSGREPRALSAAEILDTLGDFVSAAALAKSLGFDAVEIMGAEGYLIDQFLSPLTNRRDDEWGGDPARRMRFGLEVMRQVRAAVGPDFAVLFRMSGTDLMAGGVRREDALSFARALAGGGADALDVGIGWHESPVPTVQALVPPGTWAPVAAAVKKAVGPTPVVAGVRINRVEIADRILAAGQADFVAMARPFLADARLVEASRRGRPVNICIGCNQACIDRSLSDGDETVSCLVNPRAGHEDEVPHQVRAATPARVAVIGGGPAGLYAACDLAAAGHRVSLFEAADVPGGQFRLAARVPGKGDYAATIEYLAAELTALGGTIECGRPVGPADLRLLRGFDGLIVATGVRPRRLEVSGADLPHVLSYAGAFTPELGARVVIVGGGGIAIDAAHYASRGGWRTVTILHRGARVGTKLGRSTRWAVLRVLRAAGVRIHTSVRCERITPEGVEIRDGEGMSCLVPADTVVIAVGQEADDGVMELAHQAAVWYRLIGGAREPTGLNAVRAITDAQQAAAEFTARENGGMSGAVRHGHQGHQLQPADAGLRAAARTAAERPRGGDDRAEPRRDPRRARPVR